MKRVLLLLAATGCVALFSSAARAQCGTLGGECLDDGGLRLATAGSQTSNSAWVLTSDFPDPGAPTDGAAQFQGGFGDADNVANPGGTGVWFKSFLGIRGGNTSIPTANADLTQSVVVPVGGDYLLKFVAGREANFTAGDFSVALSSGGTGGSASIDLLTAPMILGNIGGAASPALGGNPFSLLLSGVSAGDTLTVAGQMVDGQDFNMPGGQSAFLDSFSLARVPEPTTFTLVGLAMFGLVGIRRRSH